MDFPEIWPSVPLEQLVEMQPGFARKPNDDRSGFPQIRTNNVTNAGVIDLTDLKYVDASTEEREKYGVQAGDVIFNNTNSPDLVGRAAYFDIEDDYIISNHMTRLRAVDTRLLEGEFLARFLHYLWQVGASFRWAKHWVSQAAIDQAGLARIQIPLPPLPEQQRIVAILRQADELRRQQQAALAEAQKLIPAIFYEMFGDPVKNPKGWPVHPLDKLGVLDRGRSRHRPRDASHLYGGKYPFIQTGDIANSDGWIVDHSHLIFAQIEGDSTF